MSDNDFWLGAYLYYGEPRELFLAEAVRPFVERILTERLADQFFFIRFSEQGPHIRLRFKGSQQTLVRAVKPGLDAFFSRYMEACPSSREELTGMEMLPAEQQWRPNNTIHYVPYEPEIERYGGPTGVDIAERQFQHSSRMVLRLLTSSKNWDYDRALGAAIQMHLGLAWALGMSLTETRYFYARISEAWLVRAYDFSPHHSAEKNEARREMTLAAFAETFERQQEVLVAYHGQFWQLLTGGESFEQEWLNDWLCGMKELGRELMAADTCNRLIYPNGFNPDPTIPIPIKRQHLWSIVGSYVHMTNNRLGIHNRDEAYLGYLTVKSLEKLEKIWGEKV